MNLVESQRQIQKWMSLFVTEVRSGTAMGNYDIHRAAEIVVIPLFEKVYGYGNLKNLNSIEVMDHPAVDLADEVARVAVQVTSTPDSAKIQDTLRKFVKYRLYEKYERLIIYILTEKLRSYSGRRYEEIIQRKFTFDPDRDILDYRDILREVSAFQIDRAIQVQRILEENFAFPAITPFKVPPQDQTREYASTTTFASRTNTDLIVPTVSGSLPPSAWTKVEEHAKTYYEQVKIISLLTNSQDYEQARDLYWKTLYFSGYRELWKERSSLSRQIYALSLQNKDSKTSGLVLSKGVAYALLSQKKYPQAEHVLSKALAFFRRANAYEEEGIYFDYMAEIYEATGQIDRAVDYYKEAMKRFTGVDEYQAHLKQLFVRAKSDDLRCRSRVVALTLLRDQFGVIKNYREGVADIELARSLYVLEATEDARLRAQQAYHLLNDVIIMPRNAAMAQEVLGIIMGGRIGLPI